MNEWEDMVGKIHDLEIDRVTIDMPRDIKEQAERIIDAEQLGREGLLHIFATGVGFFRGERQLREISADALNPAKRTDLERTVKLLMEESTHYATLRFKARRMAEDNQILAMREAAWRADAELLKQRIDVFRADEQPLKARIAELEAENARLRQQVPAAGSKAEPPTPARQGFFGGLVGRRRGRDDRRRGTAP